MRATPALLAVALAASCTSSPGFFEPSAFYVEGAFGYDPTADAAVPYQTEGGSVVPTLVVTVASVAWFDSFAEDDRCVVVFRHLEEGPLGRAPWTAESGAWFGFDLPAGADLETDCANWDPETWGEDPGAVVAAWSWGLGIGPLDDQVHDEVRDAVIDADGQEAWDDAWAPAVFGGGFRWSGADERFDAGFAPHGYAFGLVVDESLTVVSENGQNLAIPLSEVEDGSPPTGAYLVQPWFGIDADLLAPTNL